MLAIYRKFASFQTVNDMNRLVSLFKETIKGMVPKSILKVIDFLSSHSCKIKGVAFPTYEYMADKTGLSESTLKRAIKKLKELGFIQVYNIYAGGRQSANVYQIQPEIDLEKVIKLLMEGVRITISVDNDEPQESMPSEQGNDTPQTEDKPSRSKTFDLVSRWGSKEQAVQTKQEKDIKLPFYNWLVGDSYSRLSTLIEKERF